MEFITSLALNYPAPTWLVKLAFIVVFLYLFTRAIILVYKFVSKTNDTNCSLGNLDGKLDSLDRKQSTLVEKFNTLIATLAEKNAIENPDLFSINSPINLTPKGIEFIKEIGWSDSVSNEANKQSLFKTLDKFKLKTKYDVEKYSIVLLTELSGAREENPYTPIKRYLYEHANINDSKALTACAIYLRDEYLKEHPEIKE